MTLPMNLSGHWYGVVPPQFVYARRRFKRVVLEPPDEVPGSWIGAGKVIYDAPEKQFLLTARPRTAAEGVRGYAVQIYRSADGEAFDLITSLTKEELARDSGLEIHSLEGTQLLRDPLTGRWHLYVAVDTGSDFVWGGLYWQTLLVTSDSLEGPWKTHGLVLKNDRAYDANQARDCTIDIVDGTWFCLYKAMDGVRARRPALATSTDGVNWTKHGVFRTDGHEQRSFLSGTIFSSPLGPLFMGIEKLYPGDETTPREDVFADNYKITHGGGPLPNFSAYVLDYRNMNLELVFRGPWIPLSPVEHTEHPLLGYASVVYDPHKNRVLLYAQAIDRELSQRMGINETVDRLILYESPL